MSASKNVCRQATEASLHSPLSTLILSVEMYKSVKNTHRKVSFYKKSCTYKKIVVLLRNKFRLPYLEINSD